MEKCQFSKLVIPNDPSYSETAAVYASDVANLLGFDEQACREVRKGVAGAVTHIMQRAFDPDQKATLEISCERVPMGLRVVLREQGLPLSSADMPFQATPPTSEPSDSTFKEPATAQPWDEVSLHNLGQNGQETHLIKYLQNPAVDYQNTCALPTPEDDEGKRSLPSEKVEFEVRRMLPSEAVEVARCFYRSYGYSFVFQQIYYPDRIVELNETGRLSSIVAVTKDGEIIGHCALVRWDENPRTAELGFAVVKPQFRGMGCLQKLTEYLVDKARRDGLEAIHVLAATNHTRSQKTARRFGFNACGLLVGLGPASVSFRHLTEVLSQRESYLICFNFLVKPQPVYVYVPDHHQGFVRQLYRNLGVEARFASPPEHEPRFSKDHSKVRTMYFTTTGFAFIEIDEYGPDIVAEVKAALRDLCLKGIEVIELYCDMRNPLMYHLTTEFENLGFFLGGIKPASSNGEALILQYLNNVLMDYDRISTLTPQSDLIRSYLRAHDPNYAEGGDT
jgi:RimJ/RimL family protein N-acetyltransferase/anti-sigma regulatory factor (Ser/Thr protein kinase)